MTKKTTLPLMILASIASIGVSSNAAVLDNKIQQEAAPAKKLIPSFVGIFVNNQELDAIDILYDVRVNDLPTNLESATNATSDIDKNSFYYLAIEDLIRLTGVSFDSITSQSTNDSNNKRSNAKGLNNTSRFSVHTPLGDTQISSEQLLEYNGKQYLALTDLKKLGITADYNQSDLAVNLYMGWRPPTAVDTQTVNKQEKPPEDQPIDYAPSKVGLLGLSFNSSLNASESATRPDHPQSTSRQFHSNIGAYGYGLGGVWGAKIVGAETDSDTPTIDSEGRFRKNHSFGDTALDSVTNLPSDWEVDNLYWAKSGKNLATRFGVNKPNSLGQGAQTSSSEFTGALVAYSNRDIERHLSYFDDNSSSLLQNTSQDYQHLIGIGAPGGVAELRIDGRAVARVQIELDGRYEFLNLDVSQLNLSETLVEIAIFAYPLARQPIEVRPIFLGKRRTNAATDELLVEAGIGQAGNALDSNDKNGTALHLYAEYGLNNRLAVRAGANTNLQNAENIKQDNDAISWHTGFNYTPSVNSNLDLSYANTPVQELWQTELAYHLKKFSANYQYNSRQYSDPKKTSNDTTVANKKSLHDQRHQLLLNYTPNSKTNLSLNQYYDDLATNNKTDGYYAYSGITHQFNDELNASINWDTRGDRYNYRFSWNGDNERHGYASLIDSAGLSGDNDSDTVSLRHQANEQISLEQSITYRHGESDLLYQGDFSYRFGNFGSNSNSTGGSNAINNLLSIGYSSYKGQLGWEADWQLTHHNSINFSVGYKHHYVDSIPKEHFDNQLVFDGITLEETIPAWSQNDYLYAKLSFDMFKSPKQGLKLGHYPRQQLGSVIVEVNHPAEPQIDSESINFSLNDQQVTASLLASQPNRSQYLISDIKAGDYNLKMDANDLPLEYSSSELPSPRIRVKNYTPTSVPFELKKSYGLSGKLADSKQGIEIKVFQQGKLIQTVDSAPYGYFQVFGLPAATYTLQAAGYQPQTVVINNDFVMQLLLQPTDIPVIIDEE